MFFDVIKKIEEKPKKKKKRSTRSSWSSNNNDYEEDENVDYIRLLLYEFHCTHTHWRQQQQQH